MPAKLTWLLQPLGTHAFSRFKVVISCEYRHEVMRHGQCELAAMLRIVAYAVRKVLQGVRWSCAFDANGFGLVQSKVRMTILNVLERESAVGASSQLPTYHQFALIFPRRATLPLADLLSFHRSRRVAAGASVPVAAEALVFPPAEPRPKHKPWHGRLRSSSALSLKEEKEKTGAGPEAASAATSSAAASAPGGDSGVVVRPPYVERLFIPVVPPRAPPLRKRKSAER